MSTPPFRLSEFAQSNKININNTYAAIAPCAQITAFEDHLNNNLGASINLRQQALKGCITAKKYLNAYERLGATNTAALRKHFSPSKYEYRVAFDFLFEDGHKIKYFTLNAGNLGMPNFWGRYCMFFALNYFDPNTSAILRQNSLAPEKAGAGYYYFDGKNPNIDKIRSETSVIDQAKKHCVIKKGNDIATTDPKDYPELVCYSGVKPGNSKDADYLELLTAQDCILANNYKIRLTEQEALYIFNVTFDQFDENLLGANKRALDREADEFVQLHRQFQFELDVI